MLRVRALGPCTLSGFRTLLRGDVCDVPDERREHAERLRLVGCLEFLEFTPEPAAAEPSGNEAPAMVQESSSAPPALSSDDEAAEVARLEAELAELEQAKKPKRPILMCRCGKAFPDHASGKVKLDDSFCGGLKRFMKPVPKAT